MKNSLFLLTVALGLLSVPSMAQTSPTIQHTDPSAALEVKSSTKGFLPPRLSNRQRNTILNPAMGLIIFNTNKRYLEHYDGTVWAAVGAQTNTDISFMAVKTSNQTLDSESLVTWENQYNQGGGFDDATDAFIAPVDGTYFIYVDAVSGGINNLDLRFYVNGSDTRYRIYDFSYEEAFYKGYGSMIVFLNAGDKVDVRNHSSNVSEIYGNDTSYSSRFGGFLLSQDE